MQKKRGLGFNPLLGLDQSTVDAVLKSKSTPSAFKNADSTDVVNVPIEKIIPNAFQPRTYFAEYELDELAKSIKQHGVMQPIVLRKSAEGYELVAGERRWRASQRAQVDHIPAIIRVLGDQQVAALALIENIQREQLTAIEQARALARMRDEFGMDQSSLAEMISTSRPNVANLLRLLSLNETVQSMLETGKIEMGHARALIPLPNPIQTKIAEKIASLRLSVRQAEALVKRSITNTSQSTTNKSSTSDIARLETTLSEKLGASVKIKNKKNGSGQLVIEYSSLDVLDGIISKLRFKS